MAVLLVVNLRGGYTGYANSANTHNGTRITMTTAFVFPGQGAQTIGMGKALADAYPAAKAVFEEVDEALGESLSTLIWEGEQDQLTLTQNAQPALMATSLAALRALESEGLVLAQREK